MSGDDEELFRLESEPPPPGEEDDADEGKTRVGALPEGMLKAMKQGKDPIPVADDGSSGSESKTAPPPPSASALAAAPASGALRANIPSFADAEPADDVTRLHDSAVEFAAPPVPPRPAPKVLEVEGSGTADLPLATPFSAAESGPVSLAPGSLAPQGGFPSAAPIAAQEAAKPGASPAGASPGAGFSALVQTKSGVTYGVLALAAVGVLALLGAIVILATAK